MPVQEFVNTMKAVTTSVAVSIAALSTAYAVEVPQPNVKFATCFAKDKSSFESRPKASCVAQLQADPGYAFVPRSIQIVHGGKGRLSNSAPIFVYGDSGGIGDFAPTTVNVRFSCTDKKGTGRTCWLTPQVSATQVRLPE